MRSNLVREVPQAWRCEALLLDAAQQCGEEIHVLKNVFCAVQHGFELMAERVGDHAFQQQYHQERPSDVPQIPGHRASQCTQRQEWCHYADPLPSHSIGRFGPMHQCFGMHPDARTFSQDCYIFAEIKLIAQFCDRGLPRQNLLQARGRQQPSCKTVFAHAASGRRKQFKEAGLPKQIEIGCVDMMSIVESIAGLSGASPPIFDTRQPAPIDRNRSLGACFGVQDLRMIDGDAGKHDCWKKKPLGRKHVAREREPCHHGGNPRQ
jgi:hypothetical protein